MFSWSSRFLPLDQSLLVVPTVQPDCVADITIGLRDSQKLVVKFFLLRLCASPSYDLHRYTSLLSFGDVTVRILLFLILQWSVFSNVTIGLPCWSYSWKNNLIISVLRPIFPLLPLHRVLRQSNATRSRQDFYRIMLGVRYNHCVVSC